MKIQWLSTLFLVLALTLSGCFEEDFGAIDPVTTGNKVHGADLKEETILTSNGKTLLALVQSEGRTMFMSVNTETGEGECYADLLYSRKAIFSKDEKAAYLLQHDNSDSKWVSVVELVLNTGKTRQLHDSWGGYRNLDLIGDGAKLVLSQIGLKKIAVIDLQDSKNIDLGVDLLVELTTIPSRNQFLITSAAKEPNSTRIKILDATTLSGRTLTVPNCPGKTVISPNGRYALLAPTFCHQDPVSIVDLEQGKFLENIPGFGPVAFTPDSKIAIAFGRKMDMNQFGYEQDAEYSLLVIDMRDFSIRIVELGNDIPGYAILPDGKTVFITGGNRVNTDNNWIPDIDRPLLLNLETLELRETYGAWIAVKKSGDPDKSLVMLPDSSAVYLSNANKAYKIDVASGEVRQLHPEQGEIQSANVLRDGSRVILRNANRYLYMDPKTDQLTRVLTLDRSICFKQPGLGVRSRVRAGTVRYLR